MSSRAALWRAAARYAERGIECALATVARHRGSLPMARDAKMLITRDGRAAGTVGGGCVEADVIQQAMDVLERGEPNFVHHTLNADLAGDLGLSCGGTVDLFLEPVFATPIMASLLDAVCEGIEGRKRVTVLTGLNWAAGPVKYAMIGDNRIAASDRLTVADVDLRALWSAPGGDTFVEESSRLFVERIPRQPRVIIFGAGHVGAEIARVAAGAGFRVVITDDRADFANESRVPDAHEIMVTDFRSAFEALRIDEDDYVLATTRGHSYDANVIELTAASPARYVGMLGSKRKRAIVLKALEKAGVPRAALERVRSPVGLEIGADDPAEIAVSVVAELIRTRRLDQNAQ